MLAFIKTQSKVWTIETVEITRYGVTCCFYRVATEHKDGSMLSSRWRGGGMSPRGTLELVARKLQGTLYVI